MRPLRLSGDMVYTYIYMYLFITYIYIYMYMYTHTYFLGVTRAGALGATGRDAHALMVPLERHTAVATVSAVVSWLQRVGSRSS